jgi:hypothetical protein
VIPFGISADVQCRKRGKREERRTRQRERERKREREREREITEREREEREKEKKRERERVIIVGISYVQCMSRMLLSFSLTAEESHVSGTQIFGLKINAPLLFCMFVCLQQHTFDYCN